MKKQYFKPSQMETVTTDEALLIGSRCVVTIDGSSRPREYRVVMANMSHIIIECTSSMPATILILESGASSCPVVMNVHRTAQLASAPIGVRYDATINKWVGTTTKRQMAKPAPVEVGDVLDSGRRKITIKAILADGSIAYEYEDSHDEMVGGFLSINDKSGSGAYEIEAKSV